MENKTDIIIYFIKMLILNIYVYYLFLKMNNKRGKIKTNILICILLNVLVSILGTYIEFYIDSLISMIITGLLYGVVISITTKNKIGYTLIMILISYTICLLCLLISVILLYVPYKLISLTNDYLNLLIIVTLQFNLIYFFSKIKKLKNGLDFLNKKLNNDFADTIVINISIATILIYCILGTFLEEIDKIKKHLLLVLIIFAATMIIVIQKTLKMYYKQKLLETTMKEYEKEIKEKDEKIKQLSDEKFKVSKITHEFYNRQKALELLVKETSNMKSETSEEIISQNVLEQIKSLTEEYSGNFGKTKNLLELEKTEIPEIDNMFRYMQTECEKNNIEFKLKIIGNIYPLINNIIPKNRLETLIGDHLRDAINAIKYSKGENKEILAILGIKNNKYELSIYDTGIEFEISTLLKLGKEAVTTHKNDGGSGIGFLTTFETMKQTKASLIINEQLPESHYTKSVTIRFDDKNEYRICSYRADKIKERMNGENIVLEKKQ